jgi:hypothetical protein
MNAKREAIQNLAKVADDWGWKGGKPGELTGGQYQKRLDDVYQKYRTPGEDYAESIDRWFAAEESARAEMDHIIERQVDRSKNLNLRKAAWEAGIEKFTMDMKELENAGVPREWTGKVWPAIQSQLQNKYDFIPPILAQQVSDLMRPMTNEQRQTFVNLLPRWTGTLESAASAARKLYRR